MLEATPARHAHRPPGEFRERPGGELRDRNLLRPGEFHDRRQREHWTRVRALNRRYAEGTADQYDTLRPASDLRELLKDEIYKTLESPLRWEGERPIDDVVVTAVIDEFSKAIAKRLILPIRERLSVQPLRSWQESYALSGPGSTFVRARRISDDILGRNVPTPAATPSPDQNDFLHAIIAAVQEAAEEVGCQIQ